MTLKTTVFYMAFVLVTPCLYAQPATNSIAIQGPDGSALPLRNLQLEVRQVRRDDTQDSGVRVGSELRIGGNGQVDVQGRVQAQDTQRTQSNSATQQVLVLNGRSARIALRTNTPLRLMQSYVRNGVLMITQGTVLLERGTGFIATPRWDGSNRVELDIAAEQSSPSAANTTGGYPVSRASSVSSALVVPLGEWVTVGQSDNSSNMNRSGLDGVSSQTEQTTTDVQLRITVR
jgi:Bacterial type II and III secretion system protein